MQQLGPLIIVSGPSGSGKSTLITSLLANPPGPLRLSVSATTRPRRPQEVEGVHYHFWDRARFAQGLADDAFLEWAEVYGNCYGTPKSEVAAFREQGICVLLDIDTQGAAQVRQRCPAAVGIFIRTPNLEEYERRLRARGTETPESIARRVAGAQQELAHLHEYQYQVINEDWDKASAEFRSIVQREMERGNHVG